MSKINDQEKSGLAQNDRKSGISRTLFKDTLARALLAEDSKKLRAICDDLLNIAIDPNLSPTERMTAQKIIMERVDGRPAQSLEIIEDTNKPSTGTFKIVKIEQNKE